MTLYSASSIQILVHQLVQQLNQSPDIDQVPAPLFLEFGGNMRKGQYKLLVNNPLKGLFSPIEEHPRISKYHGGVMSSHYPMIFLVCVGVLQLARKSHTEVCLQKAFMDFSNVALKLVYISANLLLKMHRHKKTFFVINTRSKILFIASTEIFALHRGSSCWLAIPGSPRRWAQSLLKYLPKVVFLSSAWTVDSLRHSLHLSFKVVDGEFSKSILFRFHHDVT